MSSAAPAMHEVFRALGDPTRLAIIEALGVGPAATSELAQPFDMALPSFTQHLDVLERCRVLTSHKTGRVRTYRLTPQPLHDTSDWLAAQYDHWARRLDQFDAHLQRMKAHP